MIEIRINKEEFKNDIYELTRAFYPGEETQVIIDPKTSGIFIRVPDGNHVAIEDTWSDCSEIRKEKKDHLKRKMYRTLSRKLGKKLPWGTLTGIRPVKIPMTLLEAGLSEEEIASHLKNDYYMSAEKINLAIDTAKMERHILRDIDYKQGWSLYVGIPFCPSICLYCSFSSYAYGKYGKLAEEYLDALFKDIDATARIYKDRPLNSIYVGGGTPTTLSADQMDRLLTKLEETFSYEQLREITVEAGRPDSITKEKLEVLKAHNIHRISINPQSMQQKTLDLIGRKHTVEEIVEAFHLARQMGFDNINMDIILGLPGETAQDVEDTCRQIAELSPDSLTIHSLALKRAARLNLERENYTPVTNEEMTKMLSTANRYAAEMNLKPYYLYRQKNMAGNFENVGYAKVDKASIYNILIMEEKQTIAGVGAGASTKAVIQEENRIERVENVKNVEQYISRIDEMIQRKKDFYKEHFHQNEEDVQTVIEEELIKEIAHGITVSNLARKMAIELGLPDDQVELLANAGMLHDIGKLKLTGYLHGHEKADLTVERMKYVRMHSQISYEVLKEQGYPEELCEAVLYHHENYDGSGYPKNLKGEDIPYYARILRVCDVFAALTGDRSYRSAFPVATAMELMIEEVKNFDLQLFLIFQRVAHEEGIDALLNLKLTLQEENK